MYLSNLVVENFRMFSNPKMISFTKGLNLLVGENGCGKSTVIDSIRALLNESEHSRHGLSEEDFHKSYDLSTSKEADYIKITGVFSDLSEEQKIEYLTWLTDSFDAKLNLEIQRSVDLRNNYRQKRWGGDSSNSIFDWEPLNDIQCVYLPALRDAERTLRSGRGSRLARFIAKLSEEERNNKKNKSKLMPLEEDLRKFNDAAAKEKEIRQATQLINNSLEDAAGSVYGQKIQIEFNTLNYERIIESLQLLFTPEIGQVNPDFRNLFENSLGYNNLIYIATILAEFEGLKDRYTTPRILLIEELEAHLHPQLQMKLLKHLQKQADEQGIQVIITTHSAILASAVPIDNIISFNQYDDTCRITALKDCGLDESTKRFINRWLDATKSTLLFSKGNIFVEGIAEAILIPKLAEIYLKKQYEQHRCKVKTLEEAGISVINMNGIYFQYFMQLYNGYQLLTPTQNRGESNDNYKKRLSEFLKKSNYLSNEYIRVSSIPGRNVALTDNDPAPEKTPYKGNHLPGNNPQLFYRMQLEAMTENCRVFVNEKTFEYDLALESRHNAKIMLEIILDNLTTHGCIRDNTLSYLRSIQEEGEIDETGMAKFILDRIDCSYLGKGLFAQILYERIDDDFGIPEYIKNALNFVLDIDLNHE